MRQARLLNLAVLAIVGLVGGCAAEPLLLAENPLHVPQQDFDALWEVTVNVLDDYFEIAEENRLAGRIETLPKIGATLLEPWHRDAANRQERLEATLQTIRRRAIVQLAPTADGYAIDVQVYKELEDLPRPQFAAAGDAAFRHDNPIDERQRLVADPIASKQWITLGRDFALEQKIMNRLQERLMGL